MNFGRSTISRILSSTHKNIKSASDAMLCFIEHDESYHVWNLDFREIKALIKMLVYSTLQQYAVFNHSLEYVMRIFSYLIHLKLTLITSSNANYMRL